MDPVTLGAALLAVISGASGELGAQLWAGVGALINRPFRHRASAGQSAVTPPTGNTELTALRQNPSDEQRAAALAEVLMARASDDAEFRQALQSWWDQASTLRAGDGNVINTISGGTLQGPVLQGRDFGDITFGTAPAPRSQDRRA